MDPERIGPLILGLYPADGLSTDLQAHLLDNGEKLLTTRTGSGYQYAYLFARGSGERIRMITVAGENMEISIRTGRGANFIPEGFTLTLQDAVIRGEWDFIAPFDGSDSALGIELPATVPVTDLDAYP
jgi:hypothetical protein